MDFTFGIITLNNLDYCKKIIESIINNNIPNYEIIIVGNINLQNTDKIKVINFDENIKPYWITKKKNLIVENAKYENVVLMHDYIILDIDWYKGFLKFGDNYDWCVTKIINKNGQRFRDYTLFPLKTYTLDPYFTNNCLLPYDFENNIIINKYMYISGSYYIIKKNVSLTYPLDENLILTQSEDIKLSDLLHNNNIIIKCNKYSSVHFLKYKESCDWEKEMSIDKLNQLCEVLL